MGVSTDGILCYGVVLGEHVALPWRTEEHSYSIELWWCYGIHGGSYAPAVVPFDESGNYLPGFSMLSDLSAYRAERRAHERSCPKLPVEFVNAGSRDDPVWVAAVPGTVTVAHRGYPVELLAQRATLTVHERGALQEFLVMHVPGHVRKPASWILGGFGG